MLCDICKKNEAVFYVTKIVNGEKNEVALCEHCAKEYNGFNDFGEMSIMEPFSFQNILSGIMDYIGTVPKNDVGKEISCKNCGMTLEEFKKTGILGCSECYKNFSSTVNPIIKRVQGNVAHVGKIPKKRGKCIIERRKLENLKQALQKAVALENYEKAAKLRDEIRDISNGKKEG
ncbi:MAG: UvrB/UvrC motif-containing protein [Clostridium sp.]|nr:UvrB/UvrC motif-containing protein [Clostridium sp.]